jgi:predicted permease
MGTAIREFVSRVLALFGRHRRDAELSDEIRTHLDWLTDNYIRRGLAPRAARAAARREFGGVDQIKEQYRDQRGWPWLDALAQDLRYTFRVFAKNRGFACVAILTFAIGIGANTAIFSLIDALVLRSLPVRDPEELVQLKILRRDLPPGESFSHPLTRALSARTGDVFAGLFGSDTTSFTVGPPDSLTRVRGAWVTGPYFETLGVNALLGRLLTRADDERGAAPAAVITEGYWNRAFARDPGVTGRTMTIEGVPVPIVGVSAGSFGGVDVGDVADITLAIAAMPLVVPEQATMPDDPSTTWLHILARPRAGMTRASVKAALSSVWPRVVEEVVPPGNEYTRQRTGTGLDVMSGRTGWTFLRDQFTDPLLVLMALVALVHLIACTNVANLLLARAAARQREVAIRVAMGAGRGRIVRQMLAESVLLSLAGAIAGVGLAWLMERRLLDLLSDGRRTPVLLDLAPHWHVLAFTVGTALLTGVAFGLAPALRAAASQPSSALTTGTRAVTGVRHRLGSGLVVAEVALSLLMVVGAGLFVQTLRNLRHLDAGVRRNGVLLADLDATRSATGGQLVATYEESARQAARLPGVVSTSLSLITPLAGGGINTPVSVNGQPIGRPYFNGVGPRYFATLGTGLVEGREFTDADGAGAPLVSVVNQSFVRRFLAGPRPLGQRVAVRGRESLVVGVVRDAAYESLREAPPPTVYVPLTQVFAGVPVGQQRIRATLVAVTAGGTAATAGALQRMLQPAYPASPIRVRTFSAQIERALIRERLMATLAGSLGVVALVLASIGLYGLLMYAVTRRANEIGVRMALGAARSQVLWLVIGDAIRLVVIGAVLGIPAAWAASRLIGSMLYGLKATDPLTLAGAASLLLATGILASALPAHRASRVDPMVALRHD